MLDVAITFIVGYLVKLLFEKISIVRVSKTLTTRLPQLKILTDELHKALEDGEITEKEAEEIAKDIVNVVLNK